MTIELLITLLSVLFSARCIAGKLVRLSRLRAAILLSDPGPLPVYSLLAGLIVSGLELRLPGCDNRVKDEPEAKTIQSATGASSTKLIRR